MHDIAAPRYDAGGMTIRDGEVHVKIQIDDANKAIMSVLFWPAEEKDTLLFWLSRNLTVRERLRSRKKSLKRELGARGRHHSVPVGYHGELVGWTRYEHLVVRHGDVNCTGEAEDPQELLLMTLTTAKYTTRMQDAKQKYFKIQTLQKSYYCYYCVARSTANRILATDGRFVLSKKFIHKRKLVGNSIIDELTLIYNACYLVSLRKTTYAVSYTHLTLPTTPYV